MVHTGFYLVLFLGPLTGWAVVSTSTLQVPTVFFGLLPWPHLPLPSRMHGFAEVTHEWLAWIGIVLFALHCAGALRHHLLLKDGLLERMAPAGSSLLAGLLAASVILTGGITLVVAGADGARKDKMPNVSQVGTRPASGAFAQGQMPDEATAVQEDELAVGRASERTDLQAADASVEEGREFGGYLTGVNTASGKGSSEALAPPPTWNIQEGGWLGFSVAYGPQSYSGAFSEWTGTVRFDPHNPRNDPEIRIDIALASAAMGDATQDSMLQGVDFFASSANPRATFRSTSVSRTAPNRYNARGTLSLKGISFLQSVDFTLSGEGRRRHVVGSATINRTAFGIGKGDAAAGLGTSVLLSFAFDATGSPPELSRSR
jgi:polyisoprenoid-binding protein YceI